MILRRDKKRYNMIIEMLEEIVDDKSNHKPIRLQAANLLADLKGWKIINNIKRGNL